MILSKLNQGSLAALQVVSVGWGDAHLAVLAFPDKVGLSSAATHLILLEATNRDEVGVYLAT